MRRYLLLISLFFILLSAKAQPVEYYLNNTLRFVDANNDTVPFPFIGGFVSPQFSDIDLNNDNIKDLVVFDRSGNKLMTFLNKGTAGQVSYIYAPQYEYFFPPLIGWVLLRDYNCDGKEDIFSASQQSGITVYKNTSSGNILHFTHVTNDLLDTAGNNMYAFINDVPVVDDVDGDGDLDIMSFGVLGGYVEFYRNKRVEKNLPCDALEYKLVDFCWGSFQEASLNDSIFIGDNCFGYKFYPKNSVHAGSTLLTLDSDEDGDLELILGDVDYPGLKILHNGRKETSWMYDTVTGFTKNYPTGTKGVYIDKFPAAFYVDVNNDGKKDLIASSNEPVSASNLYQNWWYMNSGKNNKPVFQFQDSSFLQDQTIDYGSQTAPALFDADGDGDLDLVMSHRGNYRLTHNAKDRLVLYENVGTASRAVFKFKQDDYLNLASENLSAIYPTFADLNGDGKKDLILGNLNGRIRYYVNNGSATVPSFVLTNDSLGSIDAGVLSAPHFYDIDGDSALDMILGNLTGSFSYHQNKGTKTAPLFYSTPDEDSIGNIHVNSWFYNYGDFDSLGNPIDSFRSFDSEGHSNSWIADIDADGNPEMICGSKSGKIFVYTIRLNNLGDSFPEWTDYFVMPHTGGKTVADFGARTSVAMMDADGDGRLDILIGNSRGGLHYLNSRYTPLDSIIISNNLPEPAMSLMMYPNPAGNSVRLRTDMQVEGEVQVELLDIFGRKLGQWTWEPSSQREIQLNINSPSAGTYFVKVSHPGYRDQVLRLSIIR